MGPFRTLCFLPLLAQGALSQEALGANSLLQFQKSSVALEHLIEDSKSDSGVKNTALLSSSKYLFDLADKVAGHSYNVTEAEKNALGVIELFITNLFGHMQSQFEEDQNEVILARDSVQACSDQTVSGLTAISGYKRESNAVGLNHSSCRKQEVAVYDTHVRLCGLYDSWRKTNTGVPPQCIADDQLTSDTVKSDEVEVKTGMEECLVGTHAWLNPLYDKFKACADAAEDLLEKKESCDDNQGDFEMAFCTWESKLDDTCGEQDHCRNRTIATRAATHKAVASSEVGRKADWKTAELAKCLFTIFNATENEQKPNLLEGCIQKQANVSHLSINYFETPNAAACIREPTRPCASTWKAEHYEDKIWSVKAPAAKCEPCIEVD